MRVGLGRVLKAVRAELTALRTDGLVLSMFATLLVLGLATRAHLYAFTFFDVATPMGLRLKPGQLWKFIGWEPVVAAALCLPLWLFWRVWIVRLGPGAPARRRVILTVVTVALLWFCGFIYGLQAHLIAVLNAPLTYEMLISGEDGFPLSALFAQLTPADFAYLCAPCLLFALFQLSRVLRPVREGLIVLCVLGCVTTAAALSSERNPDTRAKSVASNSLVYFASEMVGAVLHPPEQFFQTHPAWSDEQDRRLALWDPAFGQQTRLTVCAGCDATPKSKIPTNVVFVIMESVGMRYVFDTERADRMPMPNLEALSYRGLFLQEHISTSNSSHNSIFSIFSGLYPWPQPRALSTSSDLKVPSLFQFLGPKYDTFLVSPGPLKVFFPHEFLKHTGVKELWGRENLVFENPRPEPELATNEIDAVDFFLERLKRAKPPFAAVYYSYVPHSPYVDPGAEFHILPHVGAKNSYYNGLNLLDVQIDRIVQAVNQKTGPDDTLIVIVGDHGEAFGQHSSNFVHAQYSYMENLHTPALFLHPSLSGKSPPTQYTSHVDILPTVLDVMRVPYEPRLLQGQSLLVPFERDYIYAFGNENAVTSLSSLGRKVTASFKDGKSKAYDLVDDPKEKHPDRDIPQGDPQMGALLQYRLFQSHTLLRYKNAASLGEPFEGLFHPPLKH